MVKACTRCQIEKPLEFFPKDKYKKSGRTSQCGECRYLIKSANKESEKASNKKQREKNIEKIKAFQKTEEYKEYHRKYDKKRREMKKQQYNAKKEENTIFKIRAGRQKQQENM